MLIAKSATHDHAPEAKRKPDASGGSADALADQV